MILAEKQIIRTPIENMLLKEMVEEDTIEVALESDIASAIDDISTNTGLFNNSSSEADLEDIADEFDDSELF